MYTITKQFAFEAAHRLTGLPPEHPCSRLHGHSYRVELVLQSETLDYRGFVLDYRELDPFKQYVDTYLDHRDLNDWMVDHGNAPTTAENIARVLFDVAFGFGLGWPLVAVRVSETAKTWAEYRP